MGWEQRGNNQYYYRKEREGSRVKSTYVGRGELASMISEFESSSKVVERLARGKHDAIAHFTHQDSELEKVCGLIDLIRDAALLSAGFHTHKRQWRKKRDVGSN